MWLASSFLPPLFLLRHDRHALIVCARPKNEYNLNHAENLPRKCFMISNVKISWAATHTSEHVFSVRLWFIICSLTPLAQEWWNCKHVKIWVFYWFIAFCCLDCACWHLFKDKLLYSLHLSCILCQLSIWGIADVSSFSTTCLRRVIAPRGWPWFPLNGR